MTMEKPDVTPAEVGMDELIRRWTSDEDYLSGAEMQWLLSKLIDERGAQLNDAKPERSA